MNNPLVSVIMPAYNCAAFVQEAVDSICGQSLTDWELIILDDKSTDDTLQVLRSIRDPRIRVVESERNEGQAHQMNKGIALATGQYVAIAHSDDINAPDRLQRQVALFESNAALGVVGSWIRYIGDRKGIEEYPVGSDNCFVMMIDDSPFAHPTVMFRKSLLDSLGTIYRQDFVPAEDYELWARLSTHTKFDNVPLPLVNYRVHASQISQRKQTELQHKIKTIKALFLDKNFGSLTERQRAALDALLSIEPGCSLNPDYVRATEWLPKELGRISHTDPKRWRLRLSRMLFKGLTITSRYQWGTGLFFFLHYPYFAFNRRRHTAHIVYRSLNPIKGPAK